ncbi:hypothetical protein SAMN05421740_105172 [Parapedobacter koreensis]|uniref:Uncharacterized protein n=1 Tax=Parapedobacter koreensis TaxID=332977 RepID=A0A1H7Q486_9SPHI|nr:hypothetical protein SAMN05421740_105172 [Parapedobacter koreensis]
MPYLYRSQFYASIILVILAQHVAIPKHEGSLAKRWRDLASNNQEENVLF